MTPLDSAPDLGSKPVALEVRLPPMKSREGECCLGESMRELYRRGEFTDVSLVCAEQTFGAHRVVLAAESEVFKQGFMASSAEAVGEAGARHEVRLTDISNPEAVKFMLDYMYQMDAAVWEDYNPRTQEINKDVLRLAQHFKLPRLVERAMHWLSKDLTTGNVVERLSICEDFGLSKLREKILEQLTFNRRALAEIANTPQIMKYPKLMQDLLQQAAAASTNDPQPKKKGRKA
uniref:BTB domain-containing protein n=1 Tax=Alexandrium catenella TaxID=2925 RepID=A0A7S1PUQ6_ALECA|eukprot:CAMPEP_0171192892 /NCGR_PEP_ID=MMETSP0790-20130122/20100_1 /TAXON_ID=2925 /ORGANISM="Alexandrium catenella, Strain OF101" /LENGTH=232 /DNA_ID=CAMNT_0011658057 /DNA_START=12 /DNA_END=710 /DNA_ORIENTATION=-